MLFGAVKVVAGAYVDLLRHGERAVPSLFKQRLDQLELPAPAEDREPRPGGGGISDEMERLLTRSLEQTPAGGRGELFARLVGQLLPDEARILSALSEGPGAAIVHVESRTGRRVLENASVLGRTA